ncbi:MAG: hypothetical protein UW04_C0019G0006 [Parcubacteria group bacterium GW2011_GWB1_43_8]|nr:MAG: hypothetical protein UW04_C0019G0006 [Parcubacteria group bacterium GW2011_GWB1_43_8]
MPQEWLWCLVLIPIALVLISVIIIVFKTGKKEVEPSEALVYKNQWSGKTKSAGAGTIILKPGVEKTVREKVSLRNEPRDPGQVTITLADGNDITVEYEITTQKVIDPVKAVTAIDYDKRNVFIDSKIKTYFLDAFVGVSGEELITETKTGDKVTKKRKEDFIKKVLEDAEIEINNKLKRDVKGGWGIETIIGIERFVLPPKLTEVIGEASTSKHEGDRIKTKAEAAGVSPNMAFILDAVSDIVGMWKGGGKK